STKPVYRRLGLASAAETAMGLDVSNALFGNFRLSWANTRWFSNWCSDRGLPEPFIGWVSGNNDGDPCELGQNATHILLARQWCKALERQYPDIAELGAGLLENPPSNFRPYLYPQYSDEGTATRLSDKEWCRRAVAAWYAILLHGVEHGDTLE